MKTSILRVFKTHRAGRRISILHVSQQLVHACSQLNPPECPPGSQQVSLQLLLPNVQRSPHGSLPNAASLSDIVRLGALALAPPVKESNLRSITMVGSAPRATLIGKVTTHSTVESGDDANSTQMTTPKSLKTDPGKTIQMIAANSCIGRDCGNVFF